MYQTPDPVEFSTATEVRIESEELIEPESEESREPVFEVP
jgi:hypothetical protein